MYLKENCLIEIYTGLENSFSVGSFLSTIENYFLFRFIDDLGRFDGVYLLRNDFIRGIKYDTDYLRKMSLYMKYWDEFCMPFIKYDDFLNFDQVLNYILENNILSGFKFGFNSDLVSGYIVEINDEDIVVCEVDVASALPLDKVCIKKREILLVELVSVENRVLDFAYKELL